MVDTTCPLNTTNAQSISHAQNPSRQNFEGSPGHGRPEGMVPAATHRERGRCQRMPWRKDTQEAQAEA